MNHLSPQRVVLKYYLPLAEVIFDFYDQLKSRTRGYASFDYSYSGYRESDLVKVEIHVNYKSVDALSFITARSKAYQQGRKLVQRLKETVERQMFDFPIQAVVNGQPIARETVKALRKDVTQPLYGGDVTRKRKLLEKQKAGKKQMRKKEAGKGIIPQEAFRAVFDLNRAD